MLIWTTVRYYFTATGVAKIKKTGDNKYLAKMWENWDAHTLLVGLTLPCCFRKPFGTSQKLTELPYNLVVLHSELKTCSHRKFVHTCSWQPYLVKKLKQPSAH